MAIVGLSLLMSGCVDKPSPEVTKIFQNSTKMYTQTNIHYNIARRAYVIDTTNYQVGTLIPVNYEVII